MTPLNNDQKQLLFDYCIGLTSEEENIEAAQLISSNEEAAKIYSKFKATLSPLDSVEFESCPDELVEGTIWRVNNIARSTQLQLEQLLAKEQSKAISSRLWRNVGEVLAVAATIVIIAGVLITPLQYARQMSWKQACQMQLYHIWQGIHNYSADHDGQLPSVAMANGEPWWKVGYQGTENQSNTRHIWLLAKGNYVTPKDFICPGRSEGLAMQFDASKAKYYNDFPARRYVTYSFRIKCNRPQTESTLEPKVLIADSNPLFERVPQNYSGTLLIRLNDALSNINSANHNRCGQNILFGDGSVKFVKNRKVGILDDDIFTLRDTEVYKGVEVPTCETDAFLAP